MGQMGVSRLRERLRAPAAAPRRTVPVLEVVLSLRMSRAMIGSLFFFLGFQLVVLLRKHHVSLLLYTAKS